MIIIGNGNTNLFAFSNFIIIQLETMIKAYGEPISTVIGIYAFRGQFVKVGRGNWLRGFAGSEKAGVLISFFFKEGSTLTGSCFPSPRIFKTTRFLALSKSNLHSRKRIQPTPSVRFLTLPVNLPNSSNISSLPLDLGMLPTKRRRFGTLMLTFSVLPGLIS
jgi:hypothetical protein